MALRTEYNPNNHIFHTIMRNGTLDPYTDTIVYDGGELSDDGEDGDPEYKQEEEKDGD